MFDDKRDEKEESFRREEYIFELVDGSDIFAEDGCLLIGYISNLFTKGLQLC